MMEINRISSNTQIGATARAPGIKSTQAPSRLLNQILIAFSDSISQGFHGYSTQPGYNILDQLQSVRKLNNYTNPLAKEVEPSTASLTALKKRRSMLDISEFNRQVAETSVPLAPEAAIIIDHKSLSTLGSSYYYNKLPEFCFLNILREISEFYENIDQLLSTPNGDGSSAGLPDSKKAHMYSDSLNSIRDLARDGEILISQRLVNRLLEIVLTEFSSFSLADESFLSITAKITSKSFRGNKETYHPQRLETASKEFQMLVLRAMKKIDSFVHR